MVFGILSLSLLLHSQRFGRCVLRPSSSVSCRTREPTQNFLPRPLFNPLRSLALIPLNIVPSSTKIPEQGWRTHRPKRYEYNIKDEKTIVQKPWIIKITKARGGARGVTVIVVGNGHGDTSSNPGRDWLHFT